MKYHKLTTPFIRSSCISPYTTGCGTYVRKLGIIKEFAHGKRVTPSTGDRACMHQRGYPG